MDELQSCTNNDSPHKNKILLVEDDDKVAELMSTHLSRYGYKVVMARQFRAIDEEVRTSKPDLIILDINLPFYDGFYWCRLIRRTTKAPILFVSARNGDMDQVFALEHGGDDYIVKPFHPEVVMAKVKALFRRAYGEYRDPLPSGVNAVPEQYTYAGVDIDLRRSTLARDGQIEALTKTELELLRLFIEADGGVVARDKILETLWDDVHFVDDNTLTVNVTRLRRKLEKFGLMDVIVTVRGLGYRLLRRGELELAQTKQGDRKR